MLVKVVKVFPMEERPYTSREGRTEIFKSKLFILTDGLSTFGAEATQSTAQLLEELCIVADNVGEAHLTFRCREYKDSSQKDRISNDVTLQSFMPI